MTKDYLGDSSGHHLKQSMVEVLVQRHIEDQGALHIRAAFSAFYVVVWRKGTFRRLLRLLPAHGGGGDGGQGCPHAAVPAAVSEMAQRLGTERLGPSSARVPVASPHFLPQCRIEGQ